MAAIVARLRSPATRALREAGPPNRQVIVAAGIGLLFDLVLWLLGPTRGMPWPVNAIAPAALTSIVALVDRDGWMVRRAMVDVAVQQRDRWARGGFSAGRGGFPAGPAAAAAWLEDPANSGASTLERASVLIGAGRHDEAAALIETMAPETETQHASALRIGAFLRGRTSGSIDVAATRAAIDRLALESNERRYQLTSLAWSQVWIDVERRRPWRAAFADAVRDLGPFPVPGRMALIIWLQHFAAPFAIVLATAIVALIFRP